MKRPRISPSGSRRRWLLTASPFLLFACWSPVVYGESQQEILFFTSVDAFKNLSGTSEGVDDSYTRPAVDVLYSFSGEKFRFLAEYLWSSEESELERMKMGWQTGDNTMLWLGRFHAPGKYWTTEYHHGKFVQPTITRPSIEEWEDQSGPMPSHVTGLSMEHESLLAKEAAMSYAFSIGMGPQFKGQELHPFDLLDPKSGHDVALSFRMVYRPSVLSLSQFGLLTAWNEINVVSESNPDLADLDHIRQITVGMFADWNRDKWRVLVNIVYFNHDMQYIDGPQNDEFVSGYVQAEYTASKNWTVFGRTENSSGEDQSRYLRLLPAFVAHRNMLGVRWDFARFQSFTAEIADTSALGDGFSHFHFKEARIQWSAVFP